jgi:hypothetical protein
LIGVYKTIQRSALRYQSGDKYPLKRRKINTLAKKKKQKRESNNDRKTPRGKLKIGQHNPL